MSAVKFTVDQLVKIFPSIKPGEYPKVRYRVHNGPPVIRIQNQKHPLHTLTSYFVFLKAPF